MRFTPATLLLATLTLSAAANPALATSGSGFGGALVGPSNYETNADKTLALPSAIERFGNSVQSYVAEDQFDTSQVFEDFFWSTIESLLYKTPDDLAIEKITRAGLEKVTQALGRSYQESINGFPVKFMSLNDVSRIADYVNTTIPDSAEDNGNQVLIDGIFDYLKIQKENDVDQLPDSGIPAEDVAALTSDIFQLQRSQERLNNRASGLASRSATKAGTSNNKSAELGQRLFDAATITTQYAQGAALAESISSKLGEPEIAKAATIARRSLTIASKVMQAYAGNPLAGLAVLNGLLTIGASEQPDPSLEYLEENARKIDELGKQIKNNHLRVMTQLDHLQFLNENQLKGIASLLTDNIESCKNSIPTSFRVIEDGAFRDFVDIGKPLHYSSYEDILSAHQGGRLSWNDCLSGLERFFNQSIDVDPVFSLVFSIDHFEDKQDTNYLKQQLDFYENAKIAYRNLQDTDLLASPEQYVLEWGKPSHKERVVELNKLITDLFVFDPLDSRYSLLDPILVHKYVGYLLAVYPFYDFLDSNNNPRPFDSLQTVNVTPALIRSLRKALGIVNLSLAQQSIIAGIGLSNHVNAGVADLDDFENRWLKPVRHGKLQLNEYKRWTRNIYRSIIGNFARQDSFNLAKVNLAVENKVPFALEEAMEYSLDLPDGTIEVEYNRNTENFSLQGSAKGDRYNMEIFAAEDAPVDQYLSYDFSPAIPTLLRLQTLLADALLGYLGDKKYTSRRRDALLATSGSK